MTQIFRKGQMYASTESLGILIFETCLLYMYVAFCLCMWLNKGLYWLEAKSEFWELLHWARIFIPKEENKFGVKITHTALILETKIRLTPLL